MQIGTYVLPGCAVILVVQCKSQHAQLVITLRYAASLDQDQSERLDCSSYCWRNVKVMPMVTPHYVFADFRQHPASAQILDADLV